MQTQMKHLAESAVAISAIRRFQIKTRADINRATRFLLANMISNPVKELAI